MSTIPPLDRSWEMVFNDVRCVVNKQVFLFFFFLGGGHRPLIYCFINIKIIFIFIKYENTIYNYTICVSIKVTKLMAISLSVVDWKYATHQSLTLTPRPTIWPKYPLLFNQILMSVRWELKIKGYFGYIDYWKCSYGPIWY